MAKHDKTGLYHGHGIKVISNAMKLLASLTPLSMWWAFKFVKVPAYPAFTPFCSELYSM